MVLNKEWFAVLILTAGCRGDGNRATHPTPHDNPKTVRSQSLRRPSRTFPTPTPSTEHYLNYTNAPPWPLPKSFSREGNRTLRFASNLSFNCGAAQDGCSPVACQTRVLAAAFARYAPLLAEPEPAAAAAAAAAAGPSSDVVESIEVCVQSGDETLNPNVDESYSFVVAGQEPTVLKAATVFGALHGLETMTQLVSMYSPGTVYNTPVRVTDAPEYSYRGVMIDPAITYLSPTFFNHLFDGMAMNHLNVLHVHWTDIASFPIVSEAFPELSKGAYDPAAVYTAEALRGIVEAARLRGIRVIPEFDMPGHGGWAYGMPELCLASCPSVLDVTSNATYDFLAKFLAEMTTIFTDPVLMLGGDEVGLDTRDPTTGAPLLLKCFDLDPKAAAWLKAHNMLSANVTAYFWERVTTEVVPQLNRTAMVWFGMPSTGDPPVADLPKSTIANVWGAAEWANFSIEHGHPAVLSVDSWWYLPPYGGSGGGGTWPEAYLHDPCTELACTPATRPLVLGGSVAEWGSSAASFDSAVWQGAVAAAERLWVGAFNHEQPPVVNTAGRVRTDILDRLAAHGCRMAMRGVHMGFYTGTGSLSGTTHWPVGKPGDYDFVPRAACPSDWL